MAFFVSFSTTTTGSPTPARQNYDSLPTLFLRANPSEFNEKVSTPTSRNRNGRAKKEDVDVWLNGMGLQTVPSKNPAANNQRRRRPAQSSSRPSAIANKSNIGTETQLNYARNGHAVLRSFISPVVANLTDIRFQLHDYAQRKELDAWKQKVQVASNSQHSNFDAVCDTVKACQEALQSLGVTASLPFLQYFNTWQHLPDVKSLALSLGEAASVLLDVPTVRLYQDALFWKRQQDGPTPWHVDARMAPFDTAQMITFWIPLEAVPRDGTALIFCSKSHADMALPYWNPVPSLQANQNNLSSEWDRLEDRYPKRLVDYMPMQLGDVTVHSGWTLHCSNGNDNNQQRNDRMALAITFVDGDAEIRHDWKNVGDNEDRWSYSAWCDKVPPRTKFTHPLVPIVWPSSII